MAKSGLSGCLWRSCRMPLRCHSATVFLHLIRNDARAKMRRFVIPFNRYGRLERWLSARLDRQINNEGEVRWTFMQLNVVGALLMVSVPSGVAPYGDFA
jgi:hypothetical protein